MMPWRPIGSTFTLQPTPAPEIMPLATAPAIVLATAAVMFGTLSGIFHGRDEVMVLAMSGLELLTLAAIVALVIFAMRRDWHERSIE
jgi:hypothetical protein